MGKYTLYSGFLYAIQNGFNCPFNFGRSDIFNYLFKIQVDTQVDTQVDNDEQQKTKCECQVDIQVDKFQQKLADTGYHNARKYGEKCLK